MGQVFTNREFIGELSVTSVVSVSLAASTLTVGAQQYDTPILNCNLSVSGDNGLDTGSILPDSTYHLYAAESGVDILLVASLSGTAPSGYINYKKVKTFYTDAASDILITDEFSSLITDNTGDIVINDGDIDDLQNLGGVGGDPDFGTFPGNIISNNTSSKTALTQLESAINANDGDIGTNTGNVTNLETLSGVGGSTNNGNFTGNIISSNTSTKTALQQLETAVNSNDTDISNLQNGKNNSLRMVIYEDRKSVGTAGGSSIAGDNVRTLNTTSSSFNNNFASLSGNVIVLQPGTYLMRASAPSYKAGRNSLRIQRAQDGVFVEGSVEYSTPNPAGGGDLANVRSVVSWVTTQTNPRSYTLIHNISTASANFGLGVNSLARNCIYAQIEITKLA